MSTVRLIDDDDFELVGREARDEVKGLQMKAKLDLSPMKSYPFAPLTNASI